MLRRRPVRRAEAILPVRDIARASAFLEQLGLDVEPYPGGGHAFVRFGRDELWMLSEVADLDPTANAAAVYVHVGDPDHWHAQVTAAGVQATDVVTEPWGMREFSLRDPDGNLLRFGTNA